MVGVFTALDGVALLRLPGDADPDVHHRRRLGRAEPDLRGVQVLPLPLAGSLLMLVALIYLYYQVRRQLRHPGLVSGAAADARADAAVLRLPRRLRGQGADLAGAHLAARRPPEAPTGGSAVLAAIMLKLGAYGFLRFAAGHARRPREWGLIIALSIVAVIHIGPRGGCRPDMKRLVAHSSIAHGLSSRSAFLFSDIGMAGGIVQMISHGFVSAAMFLCVRSTTACTRTRSRASGGRQHHADHTPRSSSSSRWPTAVCPAPPARRRVDGHPRQRQGELGSALAATLLRARRRLHAVDDQARVISAWPTRTCRALTDASARELLTLALLRPSRCSGWACTPSRFTDVMQVSVSELLRHVALSALT